MWYVYRSLVLATFLSNSLLFTQAYAQPAPAARAEVTADAPPEAMAGTFDRLEIGENLVEIPGARWLQLGFGEVELGDDGTLTVSAGESTQTFTQAQIEQVGRRTVMFPGDTLTVTVAGEGATVHLSEVIIGLPPQPNPGPETRATVNAPSELQSFFDNTLADYIVEDDLSAAPQEAEFGPETICGTIDDRVASNDTRVGRIMPIGCTGWIVDDGQLLTAGHCIGAATDILQFQVPASLADGTPVPPGAVDQYNIDPTSFVFNNNGRGDDWATFEVFANTNTGLMPLDAQGSGFALSNTANPTTIRITGYGVDGPSPNFGSAGPRNADNQTQQTNAGGFDTLDIAASDRATIRYTAETQGGNSGGPVIDNDNPNTAVGIHSHGGCTATGGSNAGTSFRNAALWAAIQGIVRRGTGTAGTISEVSVAALDGDQVVAAMRDSENNLRLIAWDISPPGGVTRQGTGTAGTISDVEVVALDDDRVVAGMRDSGGDLRLIVWDVSSSGALTRSGTATAGAISTLDLAPLTPSRLVAAMRDSNNSLRLIVWDLAANGSLTRRGTGTAGTINAVAVAPLGSNRVASAMRDSDNNLRLIVWDVTGGGDLVRQGTETAGAISQVALVSLGSDRTVAAVRDGDNNLRVIVWDVLPNGNLTRRGTGIAGRVSDVAISALDNNTVATVMRDGEGNFRVITWNISPNGQVTRGRTGTAGAVSQVSAAPANPGRLVTAMRDRGNSLRLIVWDVE